MQKTNDEMRRHLQNRIDYVKNIIGPRIGAPYIQPPELVELPEGFVKGITGYVESLRPAHRKYKELDPECHFALCLPDYCHIHSPITTPPRLPSTTPVMLPLATPVVSSTSTIPTFSVEIKPKCGFLPSGSHVSTERGLKQSVCTFCLYQPLKLSNGSRKELSGYCPIDLFSGDPDRMKFAFRNLFQTPQNNFRLFKDGEIVYSEESRGDYEEILRPYFSSDVNENLHGSIVENFNEILLKCLLHVPDCQKVTPPSDSIPLPPCHQVCRRSKYRRTTNGRKHSDASVPCELSCHLPCGSVLHRILATQMLDDTDIEGIHPLFLRLKDRFDTNPELRTSCGIDGPFSDTYWDGYPDPEVRKIKEFMVAKTAKDCSIMIAIQPLPQKIEKNSCNGHDSSNSKTMQDNGIIHPDAADIPTNVLVDGCGRKFLFSVAVIDWDPKPLERISKYHYEDGEIVKNYLRHANMGEEEKHDLGLDS